MNYELYQKAFDQAVDQSKSLSSDVVQAKDNFKKIVFYGIKLVNLGRNEIDLINTILQSIKLVRPIELLEMFPLDKYYDFLIYYKPLEKYGFYEKDYESSIRYIEDFGLYKKIDDPMQFLMEYVNNHIRAFVVNAKMVIDENSKNKRPEYIKIIK